MSNIADWLKEWAVPLSAGVTFLLAIAAFWAIWQNYGFRKKDRKEKLLKEIIEWAVEIGKYRAEIATADYFGGSELNIDKAARLEKSVKIYEITLLTGESVKKLVTKFGDSLTSNVNSVITNIEEARKATIKYIDKINETNITYRETYLHRSRELEKSVKTLIEEATKIKIQL